jgi:hypothetical protein
MSSIESIHRKLYEKMASVEKLFPQVFGNLKAKYSLAFSNVLIEYYKAAGNESDITDRYNRLLVTETIIEDINGVINQLKKSNRKTSPIQRISTLTLSDLCSIKKINYNECCSAPMTVIAESSELYCETCCDTVKLYGAVFADAAQDIKSKITGYDTIKHYKFWIERIQAIENKTITSAEYNEIDYIIKSNKLRRADIDCATMRALIKESQSSPTQFNDHIPLLVKMFGGQPPPILDFDENRLLSIRFNKTMELYDIVNPTSGNKPYYPYFIYKILEEMFPLGHKKRSILDYIHLQNRDTVIKNDLHYEKICALADPRDGLVYRPTDPGRY